MKKGRKRKRFGGNKDNDGKFLVYAVSKGLTTGIFKNWLKCSESTNGVKGAAFQGCNSLDEAKAYLMETNTPITFNGFSPEDLLDHNKQDSELHIYRSSSDISSLSSEALANIQDTSIPSYPSTPCKPSTSSGSKQKENIVSIHPSSYSNGIDVSLLLERMSKMEEKLDYQTQVISELTSRLNTSDLSNKLIGLEDRIVAMERSIFKHIDEHLNQFQHRNSCLVEKNVDILSKKLDELSSESSSLRSDLKSSIPHKDTYASAATNSIHEAMEIPHDSPLNIKKPIRQSHSSISASPKIRRYSLPKNSTPFVPERCIVLHDIPSENVHQLSQDKIRSAIVQKFGSMEIQLVTRYKFHSNSPKFIVQFADSQCVETVVSGWDTSLLGGSKARKTIKPQPFTGFLKGVPLDLTDEQILNDIQSRYSCSSIYRLKCKTTGAPLRTIKIHFTDQSTLDKAIQDKVIFPSFFNLVVSVNLPHNV